MWVTAGAQTIVYSAQNTTLIVFPKQQQLWPPLSQEEPKALSLGFWMGEQGRSQEVGDKVSPGFS